MAVRRKVRTLLLRMQAVLVARRTVQAVYDPVTARFLDARLRLIGAGLIAEMWRIERKG